MDGEDFLTDQQVNTSILTVRFSSMFRYSTVHLKVSNSWTFDLRAQTNVFPAPNDWSRSVRVHRRLLVSTEYLLLCAAVTYSSILPCTNIFYFCFQLVALDSVGNECSRTPYFAWFCLGIAVHNIIISLCWLCLSLLLALNRKPISSTA